MARWIVEETQKLDDGSLRITLVQRVTVVLQEKDWATRGKDGRLKRRGRDEIVAALQRALRGKQS